MSVFLTHGWGQRLRTLMKGCVQHLFLASDVNIHTLTANVTKARADINAKNMKELNCPSLP